MRRMEASEPPWLLNQSVKLMLSRALTLRMPPSGSNRALTTGDVPNARELAACRSETHEDTHKDCHKDGTEQVQGASKFETCKGWAVDQSHQQLRMEQPKVTAQRRSPHVLQC